MKRKQGDLNSARTIRYNLRSKKKEKPEEKLDKNIYYEITSFQCGGGYGGTDYIRLIDNPDDKYEGTPLRDGVKIKILWPSGETSNHEIKTTSKHSSFYDRGACTTFNDTSVTSYIDVTYNESILKQIPINKIEGIKVLILNE